MFGPVDADTTWQAGSLQLCNGTDALRFVSTDLPRFAVGCVVRGSGVMEVHPVHGEQLRLIDATVDLPGIADAVQRYLVANVHGCGAARARRIIAVLGGDCLRRLRDDPALVEPVFSGAVGCQLREVFARWATEARRDIKAQELAVRLMAAGVSYADVRRITRYFTTGEAAEVASWRRTPPRRNHRVGN